MSVNTGRESLLDPRLFAREMARVYERELALASVYVPRVAPKPLPRHQRAWNRLRRYGWQVHDAWLVLIGRAEIWQDD